MLDMLSLRCLGFTISYVPYTFDSMSARVSRGALPRGTLRNVQRRKMVLDVDLNAPLPEAEIFNDEGTFSHPPSSQQVEGGQAPASSQHVEGGQNLALGQ
ncbi:hypothetical protein Ancab_013716 [Ancistrocladus abbreviatus]